MVKFKQNDSFLNILTPEGLSTVQKGSAEAQFWAALNLLGEGEGKTLQDVQVSALSSSKRKRAVDASQTDLPLICSVCFGSPLPIGRSRRASSKERTRVGDEAQVACPRRRQVLQGCQSGFSAICLYRLQGCTS